MLNEAVAHTRDPKVRQQVLDQAAVLEFSRGNYAVAASYLEKLAEYVFFLSKINSAHTLFRFDPNNIRVLCRLIRAYTDVDPKKAEQLSIQVNISVALNAGTHLVSNMFILSRIIPFTV